MPDPFRFRRPIAAISLMLAAVLWTDHAVAHQFEDGYIERAIAVRIRDRHVRIEYSIGLNDATMKKFIHRWPNDQALYKQFQKTQIEDIASPNPNDQKSGAPTEQPINLPEDGSLVNEIDLVRAFAKVATPQLKNGIRVMSNNQPLILKLVSATPSAKHHATLETVWTTHLPSEATVELSVQDANFLTQPGGIKYSLKTSGSSMTLRSNVAPILIRSTRIELESVTAEQRLLAPGIKAGIRVLPKPEPTR